MLITCNIELILTFNIIILHIRTLSANVHGVYAAMPSIKSNC